LSLSLVAGELINVPVTVERDGVYAEIKVDYGDKKFFAAKLDIGRKDGDIFETSLPRDKPVTTDGITGSYYIKPEDATESAADHGISTQICGKCLFTRLERHPDAIQLDIQNGHSGNSIVSLAPSSQIMNKLDGFAWAPEKKIITFLKEVENLDNLEICDDGQEVQYVNSKNEKSKFLEWYGRGEIDIVQPESSQGLKAKSLKGRFFKLFESKSRPMSFSLFGSVENAILLKKNEYEILKDVFAKKGCKLDGAFVTCKEMIDKKTKMRITLVIDELPSIQYKLFRDGAEPITWTISPAEYISFSGEVIEPSGKAPSTRYVTKLRSASIKDPVFPSILLNQQTVVFDKVIGRVGFCKAPNGDQQSEIQSLESINQSRKSIRESGSLERDKSGYLTPTFGGLNKSRKSSSQNDLDETEELIDLLNDK